MSSSTQELSSAETGCPPEEILSTQEIDASCRYPVLLFFISAAVWFLFSAVLGLLAPIKFHSPNFFTHCPWLTYGRIHPVQLDSFVYGFAAQAAFGVTLWLFCRLGRTCLFAPKVLLLVAKIWNLGVLIGCAGILAGDSTGIAWLEFPRYASSILFAAYLLFGIWAVLTFHARRQRQLFPTQWYLLAALFWFAWIFSAANMLLVFAPVRGVVQICVSAWYASNLLHVWLATIGLGTIFYFIPKLTNRPLHSYYLALFSFWGIALFGGWGFINVNAPLPSWIPALSAVAAMMMILPLICVALNLRGIFGVKSATPILSFIKFGAISFLVSESMAILSSLRPLNKILFFTYFTTAQTDLLLQGFFASVMFGAIYYILPRVLGVEWQKSIRSHFLTFTIGVLVYVLALAVGGIVQGINLNNPQIPFADVIKGTLPFLHISLLGSLLLVMSGILFLRNLLSLCISYSRACWENKKSEARS
ncbi:MAG: cbb3-type cytochrome c oxidase subunit I [Verrucomicrobiota bacterium]